jgi:hypothetical protein
MPLCPQITNTPITVTQNSDFDVASTIPLIGNTYDGLASNLESIEVLADGKTKVYRSAAEPTGAGINNGDLWIDIDDGNKLYVRAGGVWVSAQDASIGTAQATANAAAAAAATAQANATTALANAATAYNAAIASLQPSANTIVNASNQMTAINGTGITVYSGASATSGARVVLNSLGLAAYGATSSINITAVSGNGTNVTYTASGHSFTVGQSITVSGLAPNGYNGSFVITSVVAGTSFTVANTTTATVTDANGVAERATLAISASTGNAVFSGSVTGSTIIGGTLNIAGNAIIDGSGLLTATGATITGTINATAGYFGTALNGFSIGSVGLTGVGNGAITGGVIQTSSSGDAVVMSGTSNSLFFKYQGTVYGHMMANTSGNVMIHYGATATPAGTAYPQIFVGSTAVVLSQSVTRSAVVDSTGLAVTGSITATLDVTANRDLFTPNHTTVTDAANGRVTITLGRVTRSTASSQRYKENITTLTDIDELDPKKLLDLPVRAFTYREDYLSETDSRFGALIPGFIAEEVDAIYPTAVDYEDGQVESWNDRMIIPGLLALIQDLYKEVQLLKGE